MSRSISERIVSTANSGMPCAWPVTRDRAAALGAALSLTFAAAAAPSMAAVTSNHTRASQQTPRDHHIRTPTRHFRRWA